MKKLIYFLTIVTTSLQAQPTECRHWPVMDAKEFSDILNRMNKKMVTTDFSVRMNYKLFNDHSGTVLLDNDAGYFKKCAGQSVSYSMDILTVQTEKIRLVVDSVSKIILVREPDRFLQFVPKEEEIRKSITSNATIHSMKSEKGVCLFLETDPAYALASYLLVINAAGFLESMAIYYHKDPFGNSDDNSYFVLNEKARAKAESRPMLKVNFSGYAVYKTNVTLDECDPRRYVELNKSGKYVPRNGEFDIKDLRYVKK